MQGSATYSPKIGGVGAEQVQAELEDSRGIEV